MPNQSYYLYLLPIECMLNQQIYFLISSSPLNSDLHIIGQYTFLITFISNTL
jgi:hypothetical protein